MEAFRHSILAGRKMTRCRDGYPENTFPIWRQRFPMSSPILSTYPKRRARRRARRGLSRTIRRDPGIVSGFQHALRHMVSKRTLHDIEPQTSMSAIGRAIERLREHGHIYDADDAVWVHTTDFGDDRDRVIIRGNGIATYYAADATYYLDKRDRGFDENMYLWGPITTDTFSDFRRSPEKRATIPTRPYPFLLASWSTSTAPNYRNEQQYYRA